MSTVRSRRLVRYRSPVWDVLSGLIVFSGVSAANFQLSVQVGLLIGGLVTGFMFSLFLLLVFLKYRNGGYRQTPLVDPGGRAIRYIATYNEHLGLWRLSLLFVLVNLVFLTVSIACSSWTLFRVSVILSLAFFAEHLLFEVHRRTAPRITRRMLA